MLVYERYFDKPAQEPRCDDKAFWVEFDRLALASSDEILRDEDSTCMSDSREMELVSDEG